MQDKARRHQVTVDILARQQEKGLNTILPFAVNHFNAKNGNSVNTYLLSDAAGVLIPFSYRTYFSESGICYGLNKTTNATIVLDRTDEMNSNGFTLGSSGSVNDIKFRICCIASAKEKGLGTACRIV